VALVVALAASEGTHKVVKHTALRGSRRDQVGALVQRGEPTVIQATQHLAIRTYDENLLVLQR